MQTDKEEMVIAVAFAVVVVAVIGAITSAIYFDREEHKEKPVTLTQEQVRDPKTVESRLHVTQPEARTIVREIERTGGETPSITYYVQSPTVDKAAETVKKQIETKSPEAPAGVLKKSDRTVVTANDKLNKVDVYKISLRKAHKLKTGMTYVDNHAYLNAGYQAGRWEGLAHFNGDGFKGGTIMYTIKEW
jgi:hypothetical protein